MVTLQHELTVKGGRSPLKFISAPLFVPVSVAREAWPLQIKSRRFIKMAETRVARCSLCVTNVEMRLKANECFINNRMFSFFFSNVAPVHIATPLQRAPEERTKKVFNKARVRSCSASQARNSVTECR